MIAVWINMILVLCGSFLGLLLKNRFPPKLGQAILTGLGLCTLGIGLTSLLKTENTLCVILCMVGGIVLGEWIDIEKRMDALGEILRARLSGSAGGGHFVEGFVSATILFCVGAMSINGSIQAGLHHDYAILLSKSVMDGVSAVTFSSVLGIGVAFSVFPILIYEGGLTLLAGLVGPLLPPAAITEMSAVGGAIIVGIALNMLSLGKEKIRVGNMLPAIFLPLLYLPLETCLKNLL